MNVKHLLIFLLANCGVNSANSFCYEQLMHSDSQSVSIRAKKAQTTGVSSFESSSSTNQLYINKPIFDISNCQQKIVALFANYLFDISLEMNKGTYVKHVLREAKGQTNKIGFNNNMIQHACHVWV